MARILLLLPTRTYRNKDFLDAARALGVEVTVASEQRSTMEALAPDAFLTLDFHDIAQTARDARAFAATRTIDAVLGVDEPTAHAAAVIAQELGLPHNAPEAALAARDKSRMRKLLYDAGLPSPWFQVHSLDEAPSFADRTPYPCVLKPLSLSAGRGVMRADSPDDARACFDRLKALMGEPEITALGDPATRRVLVEEFLPGREVALEGLLVEGELRVLALFDKPDPLDGPFFEETIYVTPSRLPGESQNRITETTARAARALGLRHGPLHAELRLHEGNAFVLEAAGRTIGGLCSRTLRFGTGASLEEIVLRHALGRDLPPLERERPAAGVYMLPVPKSGTLREVAGIDDARASHESTEITITAHPGQRVRPLPEGDVYLGFVFARAESPEDVERALRAAVAELRIEID